MALRFTAGGKDPLRSVQPGFCRFQPTHRRPENVTHALRGCGIVGVTGLPRHRVAQCKCTKAKTLNIDYELNVASLRPRPQPVIDPEESAADNLGPKRAWKPEKRTSNVEPPPSSGQGQKAVKTLRTTSQ